MSSRLFIIQNGLYDQHTHFYSETASLLDAAKGIKLKTRVYAHRKIPEEMAVLLEARPAFSVPPGVQFSRDPFCSALSDYLDCSSTFAGECRILTEDGCSADDRVFIPYTLPAEIFGLARWLASRPNDSRPSVAMVFHVPDFGWKPSADRNQASGDFSIWRHAFLQLSRVTPSDRLVLGATVPQLAGMISKIAEHPVKRIPFAVWWLAHGIDAARRQERFDRTAGADLIICGDYRPEKGRELVPRVIAGLLAARPSLRIRLQVSRQSFADEVRDEISRSLGVSASSRLAIHVGELSQEDFVQRLASSRLALMPYAPARYALRASGVFTEALGYAVPVVVPDATWMSDCLTKGHGAGVVFKEFSSTGITEAVLKAFDAMDTLEQQAVDKSAAWRAANDAKNILATVMARPATFARPDAPE
jgi:hypothetical protein